MLVLKGRDCTMTLGKNIASRRHELGLTQGQLAERLNVSFQAVSQWERDDTAPELSRLAEIAQALDTTPTALLTNEEKSAVPQPRPALERIFDENRMTTYLKGRAESLGLTQTLRALAFARQAHAGQLRKGAAGVPYIAHPLTVTCHALALGLHQDELLAAALLHDVVEDCGAALESLPVSQTVRDAVDALTYRPDPAHSRAENKRAYFAALSENRIACVVKLLDRVNNLSLIAASLPQDKLRRAVMETRRDVLPLLRMLKTRWPELSDAAFLIKYQLCALLNTLEALVGREDP